MNKKRIISAVSGLMVCGLILAGCGSKNAGGQIYATIAPVHDFSQKIAGDKHSVTQLVNGDVHDYEPSAAEMAKLESSGMIVYNGLELDSFVLDMGSNSSAKLIDTSKDTKVVNYSGEHSHSHGEAECTDPAHNHSDHDDHDHEGEANTTTEAQRDPHIWMYPLNVKTQLLNITNALCEYDSENAEYYKANYETYAAKCDNLDEKFKTLKGKTVVTSHNAYGYWQEMYGINVVSMDTAGSEVSPAKMKEIVDYCKANNISVIYYEAGGSSKTAEAVAKETGGSVRALNSFESVVDGKDDYFEIMEENYKALAE